ncbi:MAG: hypothetical protein WAP52_00425, partial [Candidatus Sungiibacteriota bacterium]
LDAISFGLIKMRISSFVFHSSIVPKSVALQNGIYGVLSSQQVRRIPMTTPHKLDPAKWCFLDNNGNLPKLPVVVELQIIAAVILLALPLLIYDGFSAIVRRVRKF